MPRCMLFVALFRSQCVPESINYPRRQSTMYAVMMTCIYHKVDSIVESHLATRPTRVAIFRNMEERVSYRHTGNDQAHIEGEKEIN